VDFYNHEIYFIIFAKFFFQIRDNVDANKLIFENHLPSKQKTFEKIICHFLEYWRKRILETPPYRVQFKHE
jgi:hypothetical protein